jgi:uncharacterized protein with GYD domain
MPNYLIQVAYTSEGAAALVKNPQDRLKAVTPSIEKLGGKVIGGGMCFGEYDIIVLVTLPNNASAAALALAFGSGGAVKAVKTTPLLSSEEAVEAMRKASQTGYKPATS